MAAASENFARWVEANGCFMHPSLSLFHILPSGDRGVVAQARIKKGEELINVCLDACIHFPSDEEWAQHQAGNQQLDEATVFLKSGLAKPMNTYLGEPDCTFLSTTLLLMHERGKGERSRFKPYLDTMPVSHDCTLLWSDAEMEELDGTTIEGCGRSSALAKFRHVAMPIMQQRRDLWPADCCGFRDFQYAAGMVQSRSFHIRSHNWITGERTEGKELYLIPGIDMLNHMTDDGGSPRFVANASLDLSTQVTPAEGGPQDAPRKCFVLTADYAIKMGEEVLHTYGLLGNAALLQTYGFVEERFYVLGLEENEGAYPHPYDFVRLPVELLLEAFQAHYPCIDLDDFDAPWEHWVGNEFEPRDDCVLPENLLRLAQELEEYYEVEMLPVLLRLVGLALAQYKGSQKGDVEDLVNHRCLGRLRKAVLVRVGERAVLEGMKAAVVRALVANEARGGSEDDDGASEGAGSEESASEDDDEDEDDDGDEGDDGGDANRDGLTHAQKSWSPRKRAREEDEEDRAKCVIAIGEGVFPWSPLDEEDDGEEEEEEEDEDAEEDQSSEEEDGEGIDEEEQQRHHASAGASGQGSTSDLLSRSVLPKSSGKRQARRSSTLVRDGDPVRKRLKFS